MPHSDPNAQRVVIYRLGSLGDTVVALPCFHKVAQTWPNAERVILTNFPVSSKAAPLEVILRNGGLIDSVIAYPVGTRSIRDLYRLALQLRRLKSDVLIYLTPPRGLTNAIRDWLFFKLCGFKDIVGTPLTNDMQNCRRLDSGEEPGVKVSERECERLARCLEPLGPIDLDDPRMWDLRLTDAELRAGAAAIAALKSTEYFAINMGGKAKQKDWGFGNWLELLTRLRDKYPTAGLLVVGASEDSERARSVARVWSGPVVDACGTLSPRESAAAMRRAMAFIGHDSGPLHLAASLGISCVGVFGNFNQPKRWHPRGPHHRIIHRMTGLDSIAVGEVIEAVEALAPMSERTSGMMTQRATVFLDRDGTLIEEKHYLSDPSAVRLEDGVVEGLSMLQERGHPLVVLSNQSGIGRGLFTEGDAKRVNARVADLLQSAGVDVLAWYMCPHVEADDCDCRKPLPGMAVAASREWNLALPGSFVIGDKRSDLELADAIGGVGILVTTGHGADALEWARCGMRPVFRSMRDAADYICGYDDATADRTCVPNSARGIES